VLNAETERLRKENGFEYDPEQGSWLQEILDRKSEPTRAGAQAEAPRQAAHVKPGSGSGQATTQGGRGNSSKGL